MISHQQEFEFAVRLLVALALGMAIGVEREYHGHPAGLRTMALVSGGAALFTMVGLFSFGDLGKTDPTRIAAQVVTGVGFLGAGAILRQGAEIKGLTTAASIWVVAAIGMTAGFGSHLLALLATATILIALVVIRPIERRLFERRLKEGPAGDGHPDDPGAL